MNAFSNLMAHRHDIAALSQIGLLLNWDQETVMPKGAISQRSEQLAVLEKTLHQKRIDPRHAEWIAAAEAMELDQVGHAQLRLIKRDFERSTAIPERLAVEIARLSSQAHQIWAQARNDEDVAIFLPMLKQLVALAREEAACLRTEGATLYDALLEKYEPGMNTQNLTTIFGVLRPRLVRLRDQIRGKSPLPSLQGHFPKAAQLKICRALAPHFGYDFDHGRLDLVVHPFCSGEGEDVRITTRINESDPFDAIYSTIHELGHAGYELEIDPAYRLSPLGVGVSLGVHESQSRICENQLGRSRAFTGWLYAQMTNHFDLGQVQDADGFYGAVNQVKEGYIRTESDEVQYNLHINLRFDIERRLIDGSLEVADVEEAWNAQFLNDFGFAVDKPSHGMLQDVHWSMAGFGYFPTYMLGNVNAGCLYQKLREDVPQLDADLARGDLQGALSWLNHNVRRHGGLFEPSELIERATGAPISAEPLLDYIEAKFSALYNL